MALAAGAGMSGASVELKLRLELHGLTMNKLAALSDIPYNRVYGLCQGWLNIGPLDALRLGELFSTSPEFWMWLQMRDDLTRARPKVKLWTIQPLKDPVQL